MRNILLEIEYVGSAYAGWQAQPEDPTIQLEIEKALKRVTGEEVRLTGSGRTDSGVHAAGQAANFPTGSNLPLKAFVAGANSLLPADISIKSAKVVPMEFDARRSALSKTYHYKFFNSPVRSALLARFGWWIPYHLDAAAMELAASQFSGTHDFGAYRSAGCDAKHSVRTIAAARIVKAGPLITFEVVGNGFLRNMVRIMAGTLCRVGAGKMSPEEIPASLISGDRRDAGPTAPPWGLTLFKVVYPPDESESYP